MKITQETSQEEIMKKYPRLTAHLICQSLGYFTPRSAANAIKSHALNTPFYCEWYSHQASLRQGSKGLFDENKVLEVTHDCVKWAFQQRKYHRGYMASYEQAKAIVRYEVETGEGPVFASWF